MPITEAEYARYSRQIHLQGFSIEGQERLKSSRVLVVGLGGLGCPIVQYLAGAGVGTLGLIDHDRVELSNLPRQCLYDEKDVGKQKVDCVKERLRQQNPYITIRTFSYAFQLSTIQIIDDFDLIIDGTDRLEMRYLLNAVCRKKQKPYLFGGVSEWEGVAGLFYPDRGPCYQCLFPDQPSPEAFPSCTSTGVLGVLPGIVGTLQAALAIQYLSSNTPPSIGEVHRFHLQSVSFQKFHLKRHSQCPVCKGDFSHLSFTVNEFTCKELYELIQQGAPVQIIDVREKEELVSGQINNSLHIPLGELPLHVSRLCKKQLIICYCQKGVRSMHAIKILMNHGFSNVSHLRGGWMEWEAWV